MTEILDRLSRLNEPGLSGALLAVDHGTRTLGIAVSDANRIAASPLATIRRSKFARDARALMDLARDRGIAAFVVGLPINMDGTEGPRCQSARAFARSLAETAGLPVALWDERLSTVAAERAMIEAGLSRRRRRKSIDSVAASIILRGALDFLSNAGRTE